MNEETDELTVEGNVLRFSKPDHSNPVDWLTPMEVNTVFIACKKGDTGYILEEFLRSTGDSRGVMVIANGFSGGPKLDMYWVRPLGFCKNYDLIKIVEIPKVNKDGEDHQHR